MISKKSSADGECVSNLANHPDYASIKKQLWEQLKQTLVETQDPRILGNAEVFALYEYINRLEAAHSWKAYKEGRWHPQKY